MFGGWLGTFMASRLFLLPNWLSIYDKSQLIPEYNEGELLNDCERRPIHESRLY